MGKWAEYRKLSGNLLVLFSTTLDTHYQYTLRRTISQIIYIEWKLITLELRSDVIIKNDLVTSILFIIIGVSILLFGCSRTVYGVSEGTYVMQGTQDEIQKPAITFNVGKRTFSFTYDILSSYSPYGSWDFEDDNIVAKTDDGKYTYIFEVMDNDTIRFVQKGSSPITTVEGNTPVTDGAEFAFEDNLGN